MTNVVKGMDENGYLRNTKAAFNRFSNIFVYPTEVHSKPIQCITCTVEIFIPILTFLFFVCPFVCFCFFYYDNYYCIISPCCCYYYYYYIAVGVVAIVVIVNIIFAVIIIITLLLLSTLL